MTKPIKIWVFIMTFLATAIPASGYDDYATLEARAYVLEKLARYDIVFMGTTHKQPAILDFIADLLPRLHTVGITHLAVEVASDQQVNIDRYLASGIGLADIDMHQAIDCPRYRHLFDILRGIDGSHRPKVVAIDLPTHQYSGPVGRDAQMAAALNAIFKSNPDGKVLAILGAFHVLRQLPWASRVSNGHSAIRTLLSREDPELNMFSVAHILSPKERDCDFSRRLGVASGTVAVDLGPRFDQWRLGLTACLAIKPAPVRKILDGLIIH